MTTVWWEPRVPKEVRRAVEPIVTQWLHLLPTWVHELVIAFDADNDNAAYTGSSPQYRRTNLTICGHFLRCDEDDREATIVHEFCHVPLHPLTDWTKDLIERLGGDADRAFIDWLHAEWRERLEAATCDLERAFRSCGP